MSVREPSPPAAHPRPGRDRIALACVLAVALAVRIVGAATASLQLDDVHSLFHARAGGLAGLLESLRRDNHPPLSFLVLQGARALFGEGPLALRLSAVAFGVWHVALAWRLGGHVAPLVPAAGGRAPRVLAALLVAFAPLAVEQSSGLRMYPLLAVAVAGSADALLDVLRGRRGALRLALYAAAGLLTHYHFLHALALGVLAAGVVLAAEPAARPRLRPLAAALGGAALLALPWYATGFRAQLEHGLAPGGSAVSPLRVVESLVHLTIHETRVAPEGLRPLLLACGGLAVALAAAGLVALGRRTRTRPAALVLGATSLGLCVWSALVAWLVPRAGFDWRYLIGATAPFAALVAAGVAAPGALARSRRVAGALALAGTCTLGLLHAADPGREDYRDAARYVLGRAGPADAVVAADWQPRLFPHAGVWSWYAERLAAPDARPELLDHTDDFHLADPSRLAAHGRVFAVLRSIPDDVPLLATLRARYAREEKALFGEAVWVLTFTRPRPASGGGR